LRRGLLAPCSTGEQKNRCEYDDSIAHSFPHFNSYNTGASGEFLQGNSGY
jgi:hypothetical protein